ncbi:MAG: aminomethyl-transferring glycine dehydrogenase subunit GcvPA [Anaeromicrobium sp.]|jgi:glycine dehydrogenase subunit 1|uniref:aminomethyl-transferring glycine dehydrogenase subunit GcvPA n=1 Tax=Anaeromicrobium sp. TaxID=1929132 RepID=UPI0025F1A16B|nr:aminomethyl-transferring glycine dehydrogenase subunit GcvPA [Anaeromicrobium sp.]MCT4594764.1 aminomethyl-transferring glycine dehydrogenase subunit GcvPA [Anaeromicrobium sp.]
MHRYIANTEADRKYMLNEINAASIDDLFSDIPEELKLGRDLNLREGMSEMEIFKHMNEMAKKNKSVNDLTCFLGAGAYDHYIPAIIKHMALRSEFFTAYTPYQPEISQGTLQVIFEYQTMISDLTGMDVSNASMYDGPTACAEGAIMACTNTRRKSVLVSKTVNPETRRVLKTYMKYRNLEVIEVDMADGVTDMEHLKSLVSKETAGVIIQSPNFFGIIEDYTEAGEIIHQNKGLLITYVDPISLGILKSPGKQGADIVVGEGQSFGNGLNFGGPYLGFMATKSKLARKMPGRIVGESIDADGKRAYVLTLQAREQHIRRFKATSNICSNQGLNMLMATVYLTTLGKEGLREVATQSAQKAHYTFEELTKGGKFKPLFNKPFFKEFAVTSQLDSGKVNEKLLEEGILGGYELGRDYEEYKNSLMFCVTEKRTKSEIDKLSSVLEVL